MLHLAAGLHDDSSFLRQLCPACGDLNFRKRTELADLRGARVALLTGGRVKIRLSGGHKATARRGATHRQHALPARRGQPVRGRAGFREWGRRLEIFGLDLRHTPSRGGILPASACNAGRAGFHHQQRVPDGRRPPDFFIST